MREKIDNLINLIDTLTKAILDNDMQAYAEHANALYEKLWVVFPYIIQSYSQPEMSEYAMDAFFWPQQLERIINGLNAKDVYAIVDILYYETRGKLLEYKSIVCKG